MRSSPSTFTRSGMQSGPGSSEDNATGSQKRRNRLPIAVPRFVLVTVSLSVAESNFGSPSPKELIHVALPDCFLLGAARLSVTRKRSFWCHKVGLGYAGC